MELFTRKDVPEELTWDLTALYSSEAKLNEDMEKIRRLSEEIETDYRGKLSSVETIQACLDKYRELEQIAAIALSYCSLSASVDYSDAALQERNETFRRMYAQAASRLKIGRASCRERV